MGVRLAFHSEDLYLLVPETWTETPNKQLEAEMPELKEE
jgi:hypothetical protein